jgi:hypothetical protein
MPKKYRVTLTGEEREELERLLSRGKADVRCEPLRVSRRQVGLGHAATDRVSLCS